MSNFLFLKNIESSKNIKEVWSSFLKPENKEKFDLDSNQIKSFSENIIDKSKESLESIYKLTPNNRAIDNVIKNFDLHKADMIYAISTLKMLELLIEQKDIKKTLIEVVDKLQNFYLEQFIYNEKYANIFKEFTKNLDFQNFKKNLNQNLAQETEYLIQEQKQFYERNGIWLDKDKRVKILELKKQIAQLEIEFESHITKDCSTVTVQPEQLDGLDHEFISTLTKTVDGGYKLGVDYPTYNTVMQWCNSAEVRQALYNLFVNRGYPANLQVLQDLAQLRQELANLLGFENYASLVLSDQMAQTPETVSYFLADLFKKSQSKLDREINLLRSNLPESIDIAIDGKINPWDFAYIKAQYKKKYLSIDEQELSKFFPFDHVLTQACQILGDFFGIKFEYEIQDLWVKDLPVLTVKENSKILGYIILDLFPRQGKYSHACQETFIPALTNFWINSDNIGINILDNHLKAVTVVVANFTKPTHDLPALLSRTDVITFFHELGHALHAIFGRTNYAAFSGTSVKFDFVEAPSQLLEELVWNKNILKRLSSHYISKEQLNDRAIDQILELKHFDSGDWIQRQSFLASYSLRVFSKVENVNKLYKEIYTNWRPYFKYQDNDNFYASFGHLTGYSALYYSYLWSKILALDMMTKLKLDNLYKTGKAIGNDYREKILSAGGSIHPSSLLCNFLGRELNSDAFFKDIGIDLNEL